MDNTRAVFTGRQRLSRWFALAVSALLALIAAPDDAQGQCQYEVTGIIQGPNCFIVGPQPTFAQGMNNHGHVVGYYWDCETTTINHAFVWKPETGLVTLPTPDGAVSARATDINDHGLIIGAHTFTGVGWKAWVFDPQTQEYTYLEPLHEGATATNLTVANAINNNNVVAGARVISKPDESPPISNAVIWDTKTGEVIDLGVMNGPHSSADGLTDDGSLVVGWTGGSNVSALGFVFSNGEIDVFGPVPTTDTSSFRSVANNGRIAAHGINLSETYGRAALLMKGKWLVIDPPEGFTTTGASTGTLNNLGQFLVGCSPGGGQFRPFLWQHEAMHDLSQLLYDPPDSLILQHSRGLNDAGQVLTRGMIGNKIVGVLLTPVDRPITDLNADCVTDVHDLLMLIKAWGPCAIDSCPADFTGSGVVNVFDLLFLLANWG